MKAVIITNYWKNSLGGGIKTYLTNLVIEFQKRDNIHVDVIFMEGDDIDNYHICGNKLLFPLKSFFILRKIKPDIIYSQGTWYCLFGGVIHKMFSNTTLVHTFHTEPSEGISLIGNYFFQAILNKCDYVTFVSKGLQQKIESMYGLRFNNSLITYPGVKYVYVSEDEVNQFCKIYNIKNNSVILLTQGFTSSKLKCDGAKILIKAVKRLKNKYPNILLILTGNGQYLEELKTFSTLECISESIVFTGHINNPYIPLKFCDIYTHITFGEGLGIAILEAMVMGKPVLSTAVGGIPEIVTDGISGLLVEPSEEIICEKIDYLLQNKFFAQSLGDHAKDTMLKNFTWDKSADNFIELIK